MWNRREVLSGTTLALAGLALAGHAEAQQGAAIPGAGAPAGAAPAPFVLPPLPYAYDALEPAIDAETMRLHHDKHHATYVAKLNEAVATAPELAGRSAEELLADLSKVPESVRTAVRNHGGGHANHTLFWNSLKGGPAVPPGGRLATAIASQFSSFELFSAQLVKSAGGIFGSGWGWLALDAGKRLVLVTTANQDSPLSSGATPLLGLDIWEHAYYLRYQNRRADYLQALLSVVDWGEVGRRYDQAVGPA